MLCSVSELGMAEHSEGIMELPEDAPVGMDIRTYLTLDDSILDVDLTPNRADCFSMLGIAREVAALNQLSLQQPEYVTTTPVHDDKLNVTLQAPSVCSRYCSRIIRNISTTSTSPLWLTERLRRSGLRPIHPVVDVMNYVMIELGQPMHAFDLKHVEHEIKVRYAQEGEELELLDGQVIQLHEKVLVIADQSKPLALAGIMGGQHGAVQTETTDILLESAFFQSGCDCWCGKTIWLV